MGNQASMLRSAPGAGWSWWDAAMGLGLLTDTADTHPTSTQPWEATNSQRCPAASERAPPSSTCHKPPHHYHTQHPSSALQWMICVSNS